MLQPDKNTKNTSNTVIPNNLRPVSYTSKTLTSSESNYSNIECELLGVLFSVLHFKHFTYGCKVHMITDHKPLVSLFKKSLTSASPRLSRMLLCIIDYQWDVMYQPGTKMHLSDALSRFISHNDNSKANAILGHLSTWCQSFHRNVCPITGKNKEGHWSWLRPQDPETIYKWWIPRKQGWLPWITQRLFQFQGRASNHWWFDPKRILLCHTQCSLWWSIKTAISLWYGHCQNKRQS